MDLEKNRKQNDGVPIAIVGYSLRGPKCSSVQEFAEALKGGADLTTAKTRYPHGHLGLPPRQGLLKEKDVQNFNAPFFGLSHKQAQAMDPGVRLLMQVSYEALMDAQINIQSLRGSMTGVYVGHCFSDYFSLQSSSANPDKSGYELVNGAHCMAANRLSYFYDLRGPSMTIDTACSSSLVAVDRAARDIKAGIVDRAVVGGLSLTLDPHKSASFNTFNMLSPTGHCHSFENRADGYCRSDGVACIVLERGIGGYAYVAGSGTNSDWATDQGITYPSSKQQAALMHCVFAESSIEPHCVSYHETHGTGTIAGDSEELDALSVVFSQPLLIGSVKSNMGHAEGASGIFGIIKVLLMYEVRKVFPNFDFRGSNHRAIKEGQLSVVEDLCHWEPGVSTISNFGFGGANAFAILTPSDKRKLYAAVSMRPSVTPFSSTPGSMPGLSFARFYAHQRAIGNHVAFQYEWKKEKWVDASPLVFVLDGQGSQWNFMGQDLMKDSPVFRATIQRLEHETGIPLVGLYEDGTKWMLKAYSIVGIVSYQLGLLAVLESQGIRPDLFLGHSSGEIVCSYLAGLQTEAQVVHVAQIRTRLVSMMDKDARLDLYSSSPKDGYDFDVVLSPSTKKYAKKVLLNAPVDPKAIESFSMKGRMTVVGCESKAVEEAISHLGLKQARVACFNAPKGQTISGPAIEVEQLVNELQKRIPSLLVRHLHTDEIAYHSAHLQVFRDYLKNEFKGVKEAPLPSSWKSTSRNQTFGVKYLVDNICEPVYFQEAIQSLPNHSTVVEIGPSSGLLPHIKGTRKDLMVVGIVDKGKPIDFNRILSNLKQWTSNSHETQTTEAVMMEPLGYGERYPDIWGQQSQFKVPSWKDFELRSTASAVVPEVSYDLSQAPWSSIRHHCVRGQNLFPATGFIHAMWSSMDFKERTEIVDFKIHSPLQISAGTTGIKLHIHQTGSYCEIWDSLEHVCYASGHLQLVLSTARPNAPSPSSLHGVECDSYYPDIRRLGYEYGSSYQLLDNVTALNASFKKKPQDWISYMDACLHLSIFGAKSFGYPVGFDRVILWNNKLDEVPLWISRSNGNTLRNSSISLEGLRLEYVPIITQSPSVYVETFVEYKETDTALDPTLIAALLAREAPVFRAVYPIVSVELEAILTWLRAHPKSQESDSDNTVVLSDRVIGGADLLVTVDEKLPSFPCVTTVARWGKVRLLRCGPATYKSDVIKNWKEVPPSDPFVWHGVGSSGAIVCLLAEREHQVGISYEGSIVGLEKRMRHNFVRDGTGQHGVWVDVKQNTDEDSSSAMTRYAKLKVTRPGSLDSLEWSAFDIGDCCVQTEVAALNFRDIMRAMGQLKEKDLKLGFEFSGIDLATGARVFGTAEDALSTHCRPLYSFPTPANITSEQAATIPVVYLTAYFAMLKKAGMKKGQSILIHAGAGGVGMAAIHIAQKRGFQIFTTCSAAKRSFLKEMFGLEDDQIGDSRSEDFVETVMRGTEHRGVDVVLNQLSGPLQIASLRCLAPGGNFCEIGKYDMMQNTALGQALLIENVSFHAIDLLPLLGDPLYKPIWDNFLAEGFRNNEIVPLPVTAFNASNIVDAFRFMSQGKHRGKIVINGLKSQEFRVAHHPINLRGETHLITGGLGGVGLSLALHLASANCREVILVGRSGVVNGFQKQKISEMEAMGCKVRVLEKSVLDIEKGSMTPDRIWHAATVYRDAHFSEMTESTWDAVVKTKVHGYERLRLCWPTTPIVAISSVVGYYSNPAQTNYAFANASLDSAARSDPNTMTVRLGVLDNVGFITKASGNRKMLEMLPFEIMRIDDVLERLLQISSQYKSGVFGVYDLKQRSSRISSRKGVSFTDNGEMKEYSLKQAQELVATILGGSASQYHKHLSLKEAGLDSLSRMELVHSINDQTKSDSFKASQIGDDFTVESIVHAVNSCSKLKMPSPSNSFIGTEELETDVKTEGRLRDIQVHLTQNNSSWKSRTDKNVLDPIVGPMGSSSEVHFAGGTIEVEVRLPPNQFDFEAITRALANADFLVLRQSDPCVFNHGAPIDVNRDAIAQYMDKYVGLCQAFSNSTAIVVAVIEGEVRGGGMLFPAMADICVATRGASFGLPEIHHDAVPSVVSKALIERLGSATARRLSLTGEAFDAERALQLNLVDSLVEEVELETYIKSMLRRWKPRTEAARFIKRELFPRNASSMLALGTVAGTWLRDQEPKQKRRDDKVLQVSISNGIATLTMCDEDYQNAASFEMTTAFRTALPQLRAEARVVILASSLANFHVGIRPRNVRQWASRPTHEVAADIKELYMGFVELANSGIPIIGVLNGKVFGGGLPLALWCDHRFIAPDIDFHFGNLSRGMSPCGQLSCLLNEYFPRAEYMRAYLENSHWTARDLLRLGFVDHISDSQSEALREARHLATFIASQPTQGVRDTLYLMKTSYAAAVADEEAWLLAAKITQTDEPFKQQDHRAYSSVHQSPPVNVPGQLLLQSDGAHILSSSTALGIVAVEMYTPSFKIEAGILEENGIPARTKNEQEAVAVWDGQEDAISMALNAVSALLRKHVADPTIIGRIEVGTESNVDMSKSIKSYIMDLMPEGHVDVEGVDHVSACYGGVAALLNTIAWCRETGSYGIVVATDTAEMGLGESAWRGASAVALLIGPKPWIEIHPERASCFRNTYDFLKPRFSTQIAPFVKKNTSMGHYLEALDLTIQKFRSDHSIDPSSFDTVIFHGGMCIAFMKQVERHLLLNVCSENNWRKAFEMAHGFSSQLGGLYTASIYMNLLSLLHSCDVAASDTNKCRAPINHIGLFGYGAGSTATFLHATIHHERAHKIDTAGVLEMRQNLSFDALRNITGENADQYAKAVLPRRRGVFYLDVSKSLVAREYFREGDGKRLATKSSESFMKVETQFTHASHKQPTVIITHYGWTVERVWASVGLLLSNIWWAVSLVVFSEQDTTYVLICALQVFFFCYLVRFLVDWCIAKGAPVREPVSFSHYVQGVLAYSSFEILYAVSNQAFLYFWSPILLGYFAFDEVSLIVFWHDIDPSFRFFYVIHHILSFVFTALWWVPRGDWNENVVFACAWWLSAEVWQYGFLAYRQFIGCVTSGKRRMTLLHFAVFVIERLQRLGAVITMWLSAKDQLSLFWILLASGLCMEVFDTSFQLEALRKQFRSMAFSVAGTKGKSP